MPLDQIREEQENRGNNLPVGRIYSPGNTRQKIEGTAGVIVVNCLVMCKKWTYIQMDIYLVSSGAGKNGDAENVKLCLIIAAGVFAGHARKIAGTHAV
ncbi:MAG: hypothetical protein Q7J38_03350 [Gallionella sp.]|nr:hypothetical protein [Gallionella sp.]